MAEDIEVELEAIKTVVQALEPLKPEVRTRVIEHAFKVLGIEAAARSANPAGNPGTACAVAAPVKAKDRWPDRHSFT